MRELFFGRGQGSQEFEQGTGVFRRFFLDPFAACAQGQMAEALTFFGILLEEFLQEVVVAAQQPVSQFFHAPKIGGFVCQITSGLLRVETLNP